MINKKNDAEIIIGVGLQKSGTSTLIKALSILGYNTKQYVPELISSVWHIGSESSIEDNTFKLNIINFDIFEEVNAIADNPVCFKEVYQSIDQHFPNAKFILTTREKNKWIKSVARHCDQQMYHSIEKYRKEHFKSYIPEKDIIYTCDNMGLINYLYQTPYNNLDEQAFERKWDNHIEEVRTYFHGKSNFLELSIHDKMNWDELCFFLNKTIPSRRFPHAHTYKPNYIKWGLKNGKTFIPKSIRELLKKYIFWKYID